MANVRPNLKKRSCLLPSGCKELVDVLSGTSSRPPRRVRVNEKIKASLVQTIDERDNKLGVTTFVEALQTAGIRSLDLVELKPKAKPPVCRIVDFGKYRHELLRKRKS